MNSQTKIILISNSYLIAKSLRDLILENFNQIEFLSDFEDIDLLLNKIEKQAYNIIFIDEWNFQKFYYYFRNFDRKTLIVPIIYQFDEKYEKYDFVLELKNSRKQILKLFSRLNEHINNMVQNQKFEKELTAREKTILQLIVKGCTSKSIAEKLGISSQTVSSHRKNISAKLEIKTLSGLTVYAILNNLISMEEANIN